MGNIRKIILTFSILALIFGTGFIFDQTQAFYKVFMQGKTYFEKREYKKALPHLSSAFTMEPGNKENLIRLLWVYANFEEKAKALELAARIPAEYLKDQSFEGQMADIYYKIGSYAEAENLYRDILNKSASFSVRKKLAEVLLWQKKYEAGISVLKDLVQEKPENLDMAKLMADAYFWSKNYSEAIKTYQGLLAQNYNFKHILFKLAEALRLSGRNEEAVRLYTKYLGQKK